jgi:hypothetical protein
MKNIGQDRPLASHTAERPSESFAAYCAAQLEHHRNSGDAFDEALFAQAVDLVVRKLRTREEQGRP